MEEIKMEVVIAEAAKLPLVKIDREMFLRKELRNKYSKEVVEKAVEFNPAYAGINVKDINEIAKSCIRNETIKVSGISALAGLPGGFAMIGTIPADVAQYFGHILRILQELIYLYGWKELDFDSDDLDEETKNTLIIFMGTMFGVKEASNLVNKLSMQVAAQIVKKLPQKALTKGTIYPIVKKIATMLGVRMTKEVFSKGVAKVVPVVSSVFSGGLTYFTYKSMAKRLKKCLSAGKMADVEYYKNMSDEDIIDGEAVEI